MNKIIYLNGNSKDRRKQLRKLERENPEFDFQKMSYVVYKIINGKRVECAEGNKPQTMVKVSSKNLK